MRVLILSSGEYGSRIVNHLATHGLSSSIVGLEEFEDNLPEFIDDLTEYMPENLPECDLIIAVGLFGDINLLISSIVKETGAKSVIMPIHHPQQIPAGLKQEIKDSLQEATIVFPKPFCSLTSQGDKYIDKFVEKFGKPELEIEADEYIKKVQVKRGAPCGSTDFVAKKLLGVPVEEAEFEGGDKFHNYPCLASMNKDSATGDTILHLAGYKTKEAIKRALGFTYKSAVVDLEVCQGGEDCEHLCREVCPNVLSGDNTIKLRDDEKVDINPASCGVCEICIPECPYGAIEIVEEKISCQKE